MPASKPPRGAAFVVEVEQNLHVRVRDRPAIGPARQRRENRLRAARLVGGLRACRAGLWRRRDDTRRRDDGWAMSSAPPGLSGPMISSSRSAAPSRVSLLRRWGRVPMYGFRNGLRKPSDTAPVFIEEGRANLVHAGLERHADHPVVVELSPRQRGLVRDRIAVGVDLPLADAAPPSRAP